MIQTTVHPDSIALLRRMRRGTPPPGGPVESTSRHQVSRIRPDRECSRSRERADPPLAHRSARQSKARSASPTGDQPMHAIHSTTEGAIMRGYSHSCTTGAIRQEWAPKGRALVRALGTHPRPEHRDHRGRRGASGCVALNPPRLSPPKTSQREKSRRNDVSRYHPWQAGIGFKLSNDQTTTSCQGQGRFLSASIPHRRGRGRCQRANRRNQNRKLGRTSRTHRAPPVQDARRPAVSPVRDGWQTSRQWSPDVRSGYTHIVRIPVQPAEAGHHGDVGR